MRHSDFQRDGAAYLIRNPAVGSAIPSWLFEPASLDECDCIQGTSDGRRQAWFVHYAGLDLVLRHYWRGGMIARVSPDVYVRAGLGRTRPVAEYRLLLALRERGLPVPEPVAARVQQPGRLSYRGDLITRRIPQALSFADRLRARVDHGLWAALGRTLARFHRAGALHADLNVRNILVDDAGAIWLIDWDRGRLGYTGKRGRRRNLERLRRSLAREPDLETCARAGWPELKRAYNATIND
jgi:3-deoxy-D-manno-octulosonic acid kinase